MTLGRRAARAWSGTRAALALLAALSCAAPAFADPGTIVSIAQGKLRGTPTAVPGVTLFASIPYAAPPVGKWRWRPPQPAPVWEGAVRSADRLPPECPQIPLPSDGLFAPPPGPGQSEDCLYLNVWTGADGPSERRPVMVWLHGGGFMQGSGNHRMYDGAALAGRGVVFVSLNYRLGVLGFLAHPELSAESPHGVSGNYGILDQIAALHWLRRNVHRFGGDPDNVTVIGQSAGSMSLNLLTASPLADDLFHKGIGQTGAVMGMLTSLPLASAEARGASFAAARGASSITNLREMEAGELVAAAGTAPGTFEPIADGLVLPAGAAEIYRAGRQNDIPLLIGSNSDENPLDPAVTAQSYRQWVSTLFGPQAEALLQLHPGGDDDQARRSSARLMTMAMAQYPMHLWARLQALTGTAPLYLYRFTRASPMPAGRYLEQRVSPDLGAWHGSEIVYALANLEVRDWPWEEVDRRLSDTIAAYWINFARSGDPNGPGLPRWPAYSDASSETIMQLGETLGPIAEPGAATFRILDRRYAPVR